MKARRAEPRRNSMYTLPPRGASSRRPPAPAPAPASQRGGSLLPTGTGIHCFVIVTLYSIHV